MGRAASGPKAMQLVEGPDQDNTNLGLNGTAVITTTGLDADELGSASNAIDADNLQRMFNTRADAGVSFTPTDDTPVFRFLLGGDVQNALEEVEPPINNQADMAAESGNDSTSRSDSDSEQHDFASSWFRYDTSSDEDDDDVNDDFDCPRTSIESIECHDLLLMLIVTPLAPPPRPRRPVPLLLADSKEDGEEEPIFCFAHPLSKGTAINHPSIARGDTSSNFGLPPTPGLQQTFFHSDDLLDINPLTNQVPGLRHSSPSPRYDNDAEPEQRPHNRGSEDEDTTILLPLSYFERLPLDSRITDRDITDRSPDSTSTSSHSNSGSSAKAYLPEQTLFSIHPRIQPLRQKYIHLDIHDDPPKFRGTPPEAICRDLKNRTEPEVRTFPFARTFGPPQKSALTLLALTH